MSAISAVPLPWLVMFVNEYSDQARREAGETRQPYPSLAGGEHPPVTSRLAPGELAAIADSLWDVFAGAAAERSAVLNRLLRDADLTPGVSPDGRLTWTTGHRGAAQVLAASCAVALLGAVESVGWQRLGTCQGADCADVYIDQAGRVRRRYCSDTCLNRARVRAYRKRQRPVSGDRRQL
jgi:predicted RNA-binding Zn ribbon-like protein